MTITLDPSRLSAENRAISIRGGDVAELHARIAHVLGLNDGESSPAHDDLTSRPADVLVIADRWEREVDLEEANEIAPDGWLVLWGDDRSRGRAGSVSFASASVAQRHSGPVLWFGRSADCDVAATDVTLADGRLHFRVGQQWFHVPAWARSSLKEVLAAVAVARIFAVPLAQAAERLARSWPVGSPRQVVQAGDVTIVHDKAATTAESARGSLDLLREHPATSHVGESLRDSGSRLGETRPRDATGRRIVCCGELLEQSEAHLGTFGEELVTRCGADELIACGASAHVVGRAAREAGLSADRVKVCGDFGEVARRVVETLLSGDVLLVVGGPTEVMSQLVQCVGDSWCPDIAPQASILTDGWMNSSASCPTFIS